MESLYKVSREVVVMKGYRKNTGPRTKASATKHAKYMRTYKGNPGARRGYYARVVKKGKSYYVYVKKK